MIAIPTRILFIAELDKPMTDRFPRLLLLIFANTANLK